MHPDAPAPDQPLSLERIRQDFRAGAIGREIVLHEVVASAIASLRELAEAGAAEGTVVLAESQTAGRGRGTTVWFSPALVNLYAAILFRPSIAPAAAPAFASLASLAVADAVRELGPPVTLKWPNDVLIRGRKVAGVRAETTARGELVDHIILGVGVNLNVTQAMLQAGLGEAAQHATSLREVLGRPVDRSLFTASFLTYLQEWLAIYQAGGTPALLKAWRDLDIVIGRRVEVREGTLRYDGRAVGLDDGGHLQVEEAGGRLRTVVAGEVRLLE